MRQALFVIPLALAACGTPQEQCIHAGTRDLQVVSRLLDETEANLARGYAMRDVTRTEFQWMNCTPAPSAAVPNPAYQSCFQPVPVTRSEPEAIDLQAEAKKRASLIAKKAELERASVRIVADCRAQFPE